MDKFILKSDFNAIATIEDLNVLSDANDTIIEQCNKIAIDESAAYLSTKYDIEKLYLDPVEFSSANTYNIDDRIYVDVTTTADTITILEHYTCIASGMTAGTDITDTTYYKKIDDRDSKLLEVVMSISLFYIHKRLSPNNIPLFRAISYDGNGDNNIMSAIKWLTLVQKGDITPYNWPELGSEDIDDGSDIYDIEGMNPADGMMWGNDMGDDYIWYNKGNDPNIILQN